MANEARALVESALRQRKLDRTLTTSLLTLDSLDAASCVATGIAAVDACLRGGLPRGQLCELAGPRSSGRTSVMLQLIAAATHRGELAALVDTSDRLDVSSAVAAGIELERMLWIRGTAPITGTAALMERSLDRAVKALNLVLQAGGFGVVVIDLADVPVAALKRLPFTTWLRLQRAVEGRETTCVLVVPEPLARSAGGQTVSLKGAAAWSGTADRSHRLASLDISARVVSPRRRIDDEARVRAVAI
jgi:recombination protein RecA